MAKLIRSLVVIVLAFAAALPAAAQDGIGRAECVHVEATIGPTGEYIFVFFYPHEFNALLNNGIVKQFDIQTAAPGTVLEFNIIVPPQTLLAVATPDGVSEAIMFEDGEYFDFSFGSVTLRRGRLDTECLGAATDGRINRFDQQMLAVIYPDGSNGYDIWAVDAATSEGSFDYNVTRSQVDTALADATASGQAQLIVSGTTSSFYALGNKECQLNSPSAGGEMQTFVFDCSL